MADRPPALSLAEMLALAEPLERRVHALQVLGSLDPAVSIAQRLHALWVAAWQAALVRRHALGTVHRLWHEAARCREALAVLSQIEDGAPAAAVRAFALGSLAGARLLVVPTAPHATPTDTAPLRAGATASDASTQEDAS